MDIETAVNGDNTPLDPETLPSADLDAEEARLLRQIEAVRQQRADQLRAARDAKLAKADAWLCAACGNKTRRETIINSRGRILDWINTMPEPEEALLRLFGF